MQSAWKSLREKVLVENRWLRVAEHDMETPNGRRIADYYLVKRPDFVMIVAETRGKVLLVKEYRPGTGKVYLGFPAGMLEAGESPEETAKRELLEETGFQALSARLLGKLDESPGFLHSSAYVVLVTCTDRPVERTRDGEVDEVFLVEWEEALQKIRSGEIQELQSVAAFFLAEDAARRQPKMA